MRAGESRRESKASRVQCQCSGHGKTRGLQSEPPTSSSACNSAWAQAHATRRQYTAVQYCTRGSYRRIHQRRRFPQIASGPPLAWRAAHARKNQMPRQGMPWPTRSCGVGDLPERGMRLRRGHLDSRRGVTRWEFQFYPRGSTYNQHLFFRSPHSFVAVSSLVARQVRSCACTQKESARSMVIRNL